MRRSHYTSTYTLCFPVRCELELCCCDDDDRLPVLAVISRADVELFSEIVKISKKGQGYPQLHDFPTGEISMIRKGCDTT